MTEIPMILPTKLKTIPRRNFIMPDGSVRELLADAYHLTRYLARGFKLCQEDKQVSEVDTSLTCPDCGYIATDLTRLGQHKRKHKTK